jgi:hypothetical protein
MDATRTAAGAGGGYAWRTCRPPSSHSSASVASLAGRGSGSSATTARGSPAGGNKTRKLEFLLGDALERGADTVLTAGAVQSNHARQTAAACARLGLGCELFLTEARRPTSSL